jgi:aminomethyltransferase
MGVLECRGADSRSFLNSVVTRDIAALEPGQAAYSLLCQNDGGCLDDLIVYCLSPDRFWLVLNAGNKVSDLRHIRSVFEARSQRPQLELRSRFEDLALLALQGPESFSVLKRRGLWSDEPTFRIFESQFQGQTIWISTTGYTGERGVEIAVPSGLAPALWRDLLADESVTPAGLGCRDTLRTEMGYPLYGHEMDSTIHPFEAGLGWAVQLDKSEFVGQSALKSLKAQPRRKWIGLIHRQSRQAPRAGMDVYDSKNLRVGTVTSGTFAPSLNAPIGMALVSSDSEGPYSVDLRGTKVLFESCKRPFYNPKK